MVTWTRGNIGGVSKMPPEITGDALEDMKIDTEKIHLCDSCKNEVAICKAKPTDIMYGNGKGNDNVIGCYHYEAEEEE